MISLRRFALTAGLCLAIAYLFSSNQLSAEVIYLKNGDVIAGTVVGQTRTTMKVRTDSGVRTIQKATIRRVSYDAVEEQRVRRRQAEAERQRQKRAAEEAARKAAEQEAQQQAEEQTTASETDAEAISPGGYVLRSAVLPGWGHLAMDKTWTGVAYMGLGALALGNVVIRRGDALAAQNKNADDVLLNLLLTLAPEGVDAGQRIGLSVYLNSEAQGPYRTAVDGYTNSFWLFAGLYFVQLGHIIYDAFLGQPNNSAPSPAVTGTSGDTPGWNFSITPHIRENWSRTQISSDTEALEWRSRAGYTLAF